MQLCRHRLVQWHGPADSAHHGCHHQAHAPTGQRRHHADRMTGSEYRGNGGLFRLFIARLVRCRGEGTGAISHLRVPILSARSLNAAPPPRIRLRSPQRTARLRLKRPVAILMTHSNASSSAAQKKSTAFPNRSPLPTITGKSTINHQTGDDRCATSAARHGYSVIDNRPGRVRQWRADLHRTRLPRHANPHRP